MPDYDFTALQPAEFEWLCRDLLQKEEKVFVESFTDGRDDGIDLRFARAKDPDSPSETVIVQVKKYKESSRSTLISKLKNNEAFKVRKLNPDRYYFMTSLGLTPKNKSDILEIFRPYINSSDDIFGRQDLNDLLGRHPEVEKQHYKLWLASINILEEILCRDLSVRREIERAEIEDSIRLYAGNESFKRALGLLRKNHFVIISGMPGVGKTILARMLVNYLVTEGGFDEFCVLDRPKDFFRQFVKDKKQVFLFDDFAGLASIDVQRLQDNRLREMIRSVCRSNDKLLILTTKESIFQEALQIFEWMTIDNVERAKCFLNLDSYTVPVRARMLYSHLADANLPAPYIEDLLRDRRFMRLVTHHKFHPRIIEAFIGGRRWQDCRPDSFFESFSGYFERPSDLWKGLEESLEKTEWEGKCAVFILLSMGQPVFIEDWKHAFYFFCGTAYLNHGLPHVRHAWPDIVRRLKPFIRTRRVNEGSSTIVEFQDHYMADFLMLYFVSSGYIDELSRMLIDGAYYIEQLFTVLTDRSNGSRWKVPEDSYDLLDQKIRLITAMHRSCSLSSELGKQDSFDRNRYTLLEGLKKCADSFPEVSRKYHFAEKSVTPEMLLADPDPCWIKCGLLDSLDWSAVDWSPDWVLCPLAEKLASVADCHAFIKLCIDLKQQNRFENGDFEEKFSDILDEEEACDDLNCAAWLIDELNQIRSIAPNLVRQSEIESLQSSLNEALDANNASDGLAAEDECLKNLAGPGLDEDQGSIEEIFTSLRITDDE